MIRQDLTPAVIVPRKEHGISRKQVSPNALRTLYRLHSHGFIAYLVGGCVRDLLLGRTPKDFDIGTNATPGQIRRLFRNCVLVGRRFRLAHLRFQDEIVQVSTFRRNALESDTVEAEGKGPKKRLPWHLKAEDGTVLIDNVFGTPEEDALRRDFTINALAYNIADYSVIDYSTGLSDLRQRLIRPIGDPRVRFVEDPVRILRAVRFAASHGFVIEPGAWEVLCELSAAISRASPARLYEEVQKVFLFGSARPAFALLQRSGLLAALFPALTGWIDGDGGRVALLDAHLAYLDELYRSGAPASPALFLAAFLGPALEETALSYHREGIPYQQALGAACDRFMKEDSKTVTIPGRVSGRVHDILSLQVSLRRIRPRRPASIAAKPWFDEALTYLRLAVETATDLRSRLEWWNSFLADASAVRSAEPPAEGTPGKRRRRRRRGRGCGRKDSVTQPRTS